MKKLIALFLAIIMCLSMVACGGEAPEVSENAGEAETEAEESEAEDTNTEAEVASETIALTNDNWQDFFEIRVFAEPRTNDFDEIDRMFLSVYLVLKDEYSDNYVSSDGALEVKIAGQNTTAVEYNMETEKLTLTHSDDASDNERTNTVSLDGFDEIGLYLGAGNGTNPDSLEQNGNVLTATSQFYNTIEITRIEGNLCLTK